MRKLTLSLLTLLLLVVGALLVPATPANAANYSCWNYYSGSGWNAYAAASFSESGGRLHANTITVGSKSSCGAAQASDLIAYAWIDKWTGSRWQRVATHVDSDHDGAAWAYASAAASPGLYRVAAFHTLFVQGVPRNGWQGYQYYTT